MVRRATARSWELLPATIRWPGPRQVVLVPLGCDARVDGPTVYFDSSLAWVAGTFGITSLLAHEFHHVGRVARAGGDLSSLRPGNLSRRLAEWGPARFWATLVELEGFADCVFPPTGLGLPHQARQAPAPGSR